MANSREFSDYLRKESPKLSAAFKNFVAAFVGNLSAADESCSGRPCDPTSVLVCVRKLINLINNYKLKDTVVWKADTAFLSGNTPMNDNEISVLKYSTLKSVVDCITIAGGKVTQLIGRSFFDWSMCWSSIKEEFLSNPPAVDSEYYEKVLNAFEESLTGSKLCDR